MYIIIPLGILVAITLWFLQRNPSPIKRHGKRLPFDPPPSVSHNEKSLANQMTISRPPGTLPFVGNGIWFLQPRQIILDWFTRCERRGDLSTFEISVPSLPPAVVINHPKNVEHVLRNEELFIKGCFFRSRSWDLFGNGIINADGDLWKTQRKAGLRFFGNSNLKAFVDHVLPSYLADTEHQLDAAAENSKPVDLQQIFLELTTRLMGQMAYDMDIPVSLPFSKAFDFASGAIAERFQNPFWKMKEFFFGSPLRNAIIEVKQFGDTIVTAAVHKKSNTASQNEPAAVKPNPPSQNNLIDALLDHIQDHQIVADAAMNYLSAGRDTTAQSLTWAFYLLTRNPHVVHKIRLELQTTFPDNGLSLPLNFDCLLPISLPYTNAVFNESLRLYPPVPIEIKECTAPTEFPDGTLLPNGGLVMWIPWAMGRSKNIWGDDADRFCPERWLLPQKRSGKHLANSITNGEAVAVKKENPKLISKSAFEFPVFNGGPRSCLGKKMAEVLAVAVITKLVSKYEFVEIFEEGRRSAGGCEVCKERISQNSLTLPMAGGLPCYVRRREMVESVAACKDDQ